MPRSTKDIKLDQTALFLFVGPGDSGKSYAASSWGYKSKEYGGEDPRPAYMLELDGRLTALRNRPIQFDSYTPEDGAIAVLNRVIELKEKTVKDNKAPCHTLILDSFTSYNDFSIGDSLEVTEHKRESGEEKGRMRGELLLPTVEEYGYEAESIRKLLWEELNTLKKFCDVIITAHEVEHYKPVKTKVGEPTRSELIGYKILARDKISAKLPLRFDEIYHFTHKQVVISERRVRRQVIFQDIVARSAYPQLTQTTVPYDITDKEFYPFWKDLITRPITPIKK